MPVINMPCHILYILTVEPLGTGVTVIQYNVTDKPLFF